ncbi:MAG: alpha/beta fold hydrolase [Ktedonobacterales bacterium]
MPTVAVNDIHIYYEIHGQGLSEPLVFIGGLAIDISRYQWLTEALAEHYQVLVFDNRGAGRSDKPDIPYSIAMMADDTYGLLDTLGITKANILGLSLGGRIALELTLKHPELVQSLILVSTSAKVPPSLRRRLLMRTLLRMSRVIGSRRRYPQPYYAAIRQLEASSDYDATSRLSQIRVPTLILHGKQDRTAPYQLAEEMQSRIPGSRLIAFDGGHVFLFMRPKRFLDAVGDFLAGQQFT